jgi:hypothetical protein
MIPLENETDTMERIYLYLCQYTPGVQIRIMDWLSNRLSEYNEEKTQNEYQKGKIK